MTNGEKIKEIFPNINIYEHGSTYSINNEYNFNASWWNAEYKDPRKGEWLRMSDLSEQEDDRYKCSRCGNVIHHKNKMNLYTFNSWCGRCGLVPISEVLKLVDKYKAESEK